MKLEEQPFDWNEPMAQLAQEDFDAYREKMSYCAAQSIGMALAKLELLEKQGAKVGEVRTGKMKTIKHGPLYSVYLFTCCGKEFAENVADDATEISGDWCPFCGAKVVSE